MYYGQLWRLVATISHIYPLCCLWRARTHRLSLLLSLVPSDCCHFAGIPPLLIFHPTPVPGSPDELADATHPLLPKPMLVSHLLSVLCSVISGNCGECACSLRWLLAVVVITGPAIIRRRYQQPRCRRCCFFTRCIPPNHKRVYLRKTMGTDKGTARKIKPN